MCKSFSEGGIIQTNAGDTASITAQLGPKKRWRRIAIGGAIVVLLGLGLAAAILPRQLSGHVRQAVVAELTERLGTDVELRHADIRVLPSVSVSGEALVLRHRGRTDVPPLVSVERFVATAGWRDLLATPVRIRRLKIDGLRIHIPTRESGARMKFGRGNAGGDLQSGGAARVIVDWLESVDATLEIASSKPGRPPRTFLLHRLTMNDVALDRPMAFDAVLTNPRPPGEINTQGHFGPWSRDDPGLSPLQGQYTFEKADLGVFGGISGTLSSEGGYSGVLERIDVRGSTATPDFAVTRTGLTVPLKTVFEAVVDGTSGDTFLTRVDATFLDTSLTARGAVVRVEGVKGRLVQLDVTMNRGRMENVLRFAIKSASPAITGDLKLSTKLRLPPGKRDVPDRLELDGSFALASAQFADRGVQEKITTFSRRGRGETDPARAERVLSNLQGRFSMKDGSIRFPSLAFRVPGAGFQLAGTYALEAERIDFAGTVRLEATVSQMTTGVKSIFLKVIDPLFKRDGAGTVLPVQISGTRDKPEFKVDVMKAVTRKK